MMRCADFATCNPVKALSHKKTEVIAGNRFWHRVDAKPRTGPQKPLRSDAPAWVRAALVD